MAPRRHAYILILPSMLTTGNLFFGFYSIIRSFNHDFEKAAYALFIAAIFDLLDGRVARMTRSTSEFGVEYDSIADVVSFGIAPAILAYVWVLSTMGRLGWAAAFFFVACGALRLARFNAYAHELPKSYFIGLPIPAAALFVASIPIAYQEVPFQYLEQGVLILFFVLGLLMASNVRYRSLKDFDVRHKRRFYHLVPFVLLIVLVAVNREIAPFVILGGYALWGPFRESISLIGRLTRRKQPELQSREKI